MYRTLIIVFTAAIVFGGSAAFAATVSKSPKPAKTPELLEQGKQIYFKRCNFCHGMEGGGDGPAAEFLNPRPRNFQSNVFKFRSTSSGALPTDEDLFRTVSRGIPGTGMQVFDNEKIKNGLTEQQRWAVIFYIQTFMQEGFSLWELDEEYANATDPDDKAEYRYNKVIKIGDPPVATPELVERGKAVFEEFKCWQCHGKGGKGNGVSAEGMKDEWKFPILPRDLTKSWKYKGGDDVLQIFKRFTTGINGTPMPTFISSIKEDDRWALAHFVKSLQLVPKEKAILEAMKIESDLPTDPSDEAWNQSKEIDVFLTGNVLIKPRWQNITVDMVKVRALFNENEISFRLEWNDRFPNLIHEGTNDHHQLDKSKPGDKGNLQTYVPIYSKDYKPGKYRDALMLQFPTKQLAGSEKPHFLNGDNSHEVNLWWWRADFDPVKKEIVDAVSKDPNLKTIEKYVMGGAETSGPAVLEMNAKGFKKPFIMQGEDSQTVSSKAKFEDGTWTLVMKRSLLTGDKKDTQFEPGVFIPMAINAWDGWNADIGMQKSISSWHFVYLEKPMPVKIYIITAIAILLIVGVEIYMVRSWSA